MNKYDLKDELPYWEWLLSGQVHPRTALHVGISMILGMSILFLILKLCGA